MSDLKVCFIALAIIPLSGCGGGQLEVVSWEKGQNSKSLAVIENIEKTPFKTIKVKDKEIYFAEQKNGDLTVEETFIKKIEDKGGQTAFAKAFFLKQKNNSFKPFDFSFENLKSRYAYVNDQYLKKALKVLVRDQGHFISALKIDYIDDRGVPWTLLLDSSLGRISEKVSGANLLESHAFIFPDGPRLSKLQEFLLKMDELNPFVGGLGIKISSTAAPAFDENNEHTLKLSPEDLRFDQVQVFHYVTKVRTWIKNTLGVGFNRDLDVEVHVGFPQKTNAAFYYNGKIRLGSGDDENYSKIPQDPSIVSHEVFHSVVEELARLPYEGEGGSLNEAFADFFTAIYLGRPFLGDNSYLKGPYKRTVQNNKKWSDKSDALYGDSLIISGMLWQTAEVLGKDQARDLALETLTRLTPVTDFKEFNVQYRKVLQEKLTGENLNKALQVLEQREFPQ
ncbi:MAG: hypothetical protein ACXVCP_05095 [Bdellovibrio sp.]